MTEQEMVIEREYSDCTSYVNAEKNRRISVIVCNRKAGSKVMYYVTVADIDNETGHAKNAVTVATKCTYSQAMAIAKEHYYR